MQIPVLNQARGTRLHGQKVLALILAGGEGSRMGPLTRHRAKPVLPVAGTYRLIDFVLSNCVNSGLADVWVLESYELHTLNDHLGGGRPWDLDRTYGGLRVLPPVSGPEGGGFAGGNADALYRQLPLIREFAPDVLLVLSADHLYTLDYGQVLAEHLRRKAHLTMVTTTVPPHDTATRFGNVQLTRGGRVRRFAYKPKRALSDTVTTEVFLYDMPTLERTLEQLHAQHTNLKDYGDYLLPALVKGGRAYCFSLQSYWRDVGVPEAYWRAHMELLDGSGITLNQPDWPLYTLPAPQVPTRICASAQVTDSLIGPGSTIRGTVTRSVLGPGVTVEEGATLEECVLLGHCQVSAGVHLRRVIVDTGHDLPPNLHWRGERIKIMGDTGEENEAD
ncbi:glucose-1-phosphate adenylyltransferase family protein [Hymenobacter pini]|uniref:glucose-1-phosphate adenylyltransferase family protein n=1 Tax=Hymenobacter pini TaxID=2880879 RepID=UPI001CF41C03|nr:sugar phosphate nucleotidyltransferase [Hymenobacter pini]MCA8829152.1 NTP transferase domain-containing protein [Hymenobacter pini]